MYPVAINRFAYVRQTRVLMTRALNTTADLEEYIPMANSTDTRPEGKRNLAGNRIAGQGAISGVVHVIRDESEVQRFREGEILVARMTDPSWSAIFPLAKALITEVGGEKSHAAIVAGEFDIPAIVGVDDAMEQLRSGDIVTLQLDGTIERMEERREPDSPMRVSVPAAVAARQLSESIITDPAVVPLLENKASDGPDLDVEDQQSAG